jgi:hypothetical protein
MQLSQPVPLPVMCALETWRASGDRTQARLNGLVEAFAKSYGLLDILPALQEQAWSFTKSWERVA